jgi:hypothetical protein
MLQHYRAMPRDETQGQQVYRWFICNDSILTDRDHVQSVVDRWVTRPNVSADVRLANEHTIRIAVHGAPTPNQRDRLAKAMGREVERIEGESLKAGIELTDEGR